MGPPIMTVSTLKAGRKARKSATKARRPLNQLYDKPADATEVDSAVETPEQAFVFGKAQGLSQDTVTLLQNRLRYVSMMLVITYGTYLIRSFFLPDAQMQIPQAALVAFCVGNFFLLRAERFQLSLLQLRINEIVLFSLTTSFLVLYSYALTVHTAREGEIAGVVRAVEGAVLYHYALVVLYGLFIPNTWQRAAVISSVIALGPFAMIILALMFHPELPLIVEYTGNPEALSSNLLKMAIAVFCAAFGAHIIHRLRRAAFKANLMGQYQLQRMLSVGGMGEIYLANHRLMKRDCAVKLIRAELTGDENILSRFELEVQATAGLSHPNTVSIYDYGRTAEGDLYYVMEYLPGLNLNDFIVHFGPMHPARVIYLLTQICDALQEAHQQGIIHRDLKPANIIVTHRGGEFDVAKVLDFGLVQSMGELNSGDDYAEVIPGTPKYMSPEQVTRGITLDARSDIYALGAVGYFLLTGRAPLEADNDRDVLKALINTPPPPPSKWRKDIPPMLEKVVLKCLQKDPEKRFDNIHKLKIALIKCNGPKSWNKAYAHAWWKNQIKREPEFMAGIGFGDARLKPGISLQ